MKRKRPKTEMEDFEKKLKLTESMEIEPTADEEANNKSSKTLLLLRRFLAVQQRRAQAYANLKRYAFFLIHFSTIKSTQISFIGHRETIVSDKFMEWDMPT